MGGAVLSPLRTLSTQFVKASFLSFARRIFLTRTRLVWRSAAGTPTNSHVCLDDGNGASTNCVGSRRSPELTRNGHGLPLVRNIRTTLLDASDPRSGTIHCGFKSRCSPLADYPNRRLHADAGDIPPGRLTLERPWGQKVASPLNGDAVP